jgi:DNA-binding NarL/FixJ family response regulator
LGYASPTQSFFYEYKTNQTNEQIGENTMTKTVLIIDDHPVYRSGLRAIIEISGNYKVLEEAGTAREGLDIALKIKPDIVIVDLALPDMNGIDLTKEIMMKLEHTCVMIVSAHSMIDFVARSVRAGAMGYVIKESDSECILKCLDTIVQGKRFIDSSLSDKLCELFVSLDLPAMKDAEFPENYGKLSERELEVLRLIAENHSVRAISEKLGISPHTVRSHKANIMKKTGMRDKIGLIRYAADMGLIDMDLWKKGGRLD